jgi:hypothetical protein
MSKERYNQIIDEVYKNYEKQYSTFEIGIVKSIAGNNPMVDSLLKNNSSILSQQEFINKCKTNKDFSEKWGLKIEERELSLEERLDLAAKTYELFDPFDFGIPGKVDHDEVDKLYPVAKRIITLQYNEEKVEVYDN